MRSILTLTLNPSLDVATTFGRVRSTDKLRCVAPKTDPGGGGINVARVMTRLGGAATAIFTAGGPNDQALEELLAAEGIASQQLEIGGSTRQSFNVFDRSTRQQYRFVMPGPELDASDCRRCLDHIRASLDDVDYLVASGSLSPGVPTDFYARIARLSLERGTRLILDTSGEALAAALEEPIFLIKPNARELRALADDPSLDDDGLISFARELVSVGKCQIVALSLGERGAVLITRDQVLAVSSPLVEIQSAVGAGDSFVGALTLSLARREDYGTALRFGVAAGSAALLTPGTDLCRREDVERLFRQLAIR
ncbi:MAG: 1-phosphofructokinase family hexose kinase [Geminicoccaceae bacterium]